MARLVVFAALFFAAQVALAAASSSSCEFCGKSAQGNAWSFDFSTLPSATFKVNGSNGEFSYYISSPCSNADPTDDCYFSPIRGPGLQVIGSDCLYLGVLTSNTSVEVGTPNAAGNAVSGVNITLYDGQVGGAGYDRTLRFVLECDPSAPASNPPSGPVVESPAYTYTTVWRHPSACGERVPACRQPAPPAPPAKPCRMCAPTWKPTWNMKNSTILYACNSSGFHNITEAVSYGVTVYDWSNAKQIWANTKPMNDEELLTVQAERVLAVDPGMGPEYQPRVWIYRNTIKALNWYTSVRVKLDDPAYAGWFIRFKDYKGPSSNHSYHVPACTYEKCSGFYHDQEQTPEHPRGDGSCVDECDCGKAPCGEYIFDFRNDTITDWFINEYMITNETLLHKPISLGLGWLDDSMTINGPTEEDKNFISDTGSSHQDMVDMVNAYEATMLKFHLKLTSMGGWSWQLTRGQGPKIKDQPSAVCLSNLRAWCTEDNVEAQRAALYLVSANDALSAAEQYTAQFLISRGPYAWIGFGWMGCSAAPRPRPAMWDTDYGEPQGICAETEPNSGVFQRSWTKATVTWDCNSGKGSITQL